MSVLELTLSYTRQYTQAISVSEIADVDFLHTKRKTIFYAMMVFLISGAVLYILFAGSVVALSREHSIQSRALSEAKAKAQEIERTSLLEGRLFTPEYFIAQGYEEPRSLDTIVRSHNVAENSFNNTRKYY